MGRELGRRGREEKPRPHTIWGDLIPFSEHCIERVPFFWGGIGQSFTATDTQLYPLWAAPSASLYRLRGSSRTCHNSPMSQKGSIRSHRMAFIETPFLCYRVYCASDVNDGNETSTSPTPSIHAQDALLFILLRAWWGVYWIQKSHYNSFDWGEEKKNFGKMLPKSLSLSSSAFVCVLFVCLRVSPLASVCPRGCFFVLFLFTCILRSEWTACSY